MTEKIKGSSVRVHTDTLDKIRYLSKISGKTQVQFLREIISEIFGSCVSFETLSITYERHFDDLTLTFFGKSRMVRGIDSVKDFERKSKELEKGSK